VTLRNLPRDSVQDAEADRSPTPALEELRRIRNPTIVPVLGGEAARIGAWRGAHRHRGIAAAGIAPRVPVVPMEPGRGTARARRNRVVPEDQGGPIRGALA